MEGAVNDLVREWYLRYPRAEHRRSVSDLCTATYMRGAFVATIPTLPARGD